MHELWITSLFNKALGAPTAAMLQALGRPPHDPAHPWANWMVCEILVVLFIVVLFSWLRSRLSVDNPGKLQHTMEVVYDFVRASAEDVVGHDGAKLVPFFGTIFLFILSMNLSFLIPGIEAPTGYVAVPIGMALTTFVTYNALGIRANGPGYIKQFLGPMPILIPLLLPIELVSHCARPLSLSVRLWANMLAGEQVYTTFLSITKAIIPVIFIGLHTFVALIQAYIFMLLAMVYVGGAVSHEH